MIRTLVITIVLGFIALAVPFVVPHVLMPDLVSGTHVDTEASCQACHEPWQGPTVERCQSCHDDIAPLRGTGDGIHGGTQACVVCHSEHQGRDHDTRGLDPRTFDHTRTGFWLLPLHEGVSCVECHAESAIYRGLDPACLDCHGDWRYGGYDHASGQAGFPLSRFHRQSDCAACHERGRGLAAGPHQICADCHGVWTAENFDHNVTGFTLSGTRKHMACDACHKASDYADLDPDCTGCPW